LESSHATILDFVQILHTLGDINQKVRASGIRAKRPNLPGIGNIPTILICKNASASFEIVARADFSRFNILCQLLLERQGLDVETIVLVL
jgi:hypothetical protein